MTGVQTCALPISWLDLDDDELEILQKLNLNSTLMEDIDTARQSVGLVRRDQGKKVGIEELYDQINAVNIIHVDGEEDEDENLNQKSTEEKMENLQQSLDDFF